MTPYYRDDWLTIHEGDCREVMASMEPESVHCVVTSPPYWGLRDYGTASWEGGNPECDHLVGPLASAKSGLQGGNVKDTDKIRTNGMPFKGGCGKCGAIRQDSQLGLEPTPETYVENMVAVFREVRRVLRADGTVWLNLGDSYAQTTVRHREGVGDGGARGPEWIDGNRSTAVSGLKPKDLVGIPWRVAFALQADGWYLRSDIIWAKPNPMPESVTDRPTKAHEYLFLLSKSPRYYYDADAVREDSLRAGETIKGDRAPGGLVNGGWLKGGTVVAARNLRSVWSIATQPYPGAHFATFPEKLVEPCILAGTSAKGVCPECGAPWVREVERNLVKRAAIGRTARFEETGARPHPGQRRTGNGADVMGHYDVTTTGWHPTCNHVLQYHRDVPIDPIPATVLDPFAGSGTTARVAARLSRRAVLIDLNADYLRQAMKRNTDIPLGMETA